MHLIEHTHTKGIMAPNNLDVVCSRAIIENRFTFNRL